MCLSGDKSHARGYIEGLNILSSMRLCSNVQSQYVIKTALSDIHKCDDTLLPGGRIYEQREYIVNTLNNIPGLQVFKPKAAFYVFPRIDSKRFHITDEVRMLKTFRSKTGDGYDLVIFQKNKENGSIVTESKYKIVGNQPQLITRAPLYYYGYC